MTIGSVDSPARIRPARRRSTARARAPRSRPRPARPRPRRDRGRPRTRPRPARRHSARGRARAAAGDRAPAARRDRRGNRSAADRRCRRWSRPRRRPARARASATSTATIRPCATGERTTRMWSWRGNETSAANRPRPVTSGTSSSRGDRGADDRTFNVGPRGAIKKNCARAGRSCIYSAATCACVCTFMLTSCIGDSVSLSMPQLFTHS